MAEEVPTKVRNLDKSAKNCIRKNGNEFIVSIHGSEPMGMHLPGPPWSVDENHDGFPVLLVHR